MLSGCVLSAQSCSVSSLSNMAASKHSMQNWSMAESLFLIQTLKELNIITKLSLPLINGGS